MFVGLDIEKAMTLKVFTVTTDGESANTGGHNGYWKKLQDKYSTPLITYWRIGHRTDLVLNDVEIWFQSSRFGDKNYPAFQLTSEHLDKEQRT